MADYIGNVCLANTQSNSSSDLSLAFGLNPPYTSPPELKFPDPQFVSKPAGLNVNLREDTDYAPAEGIRKRTTKKSSKSGRKRQDDESPLISCSRNEIRGSQSHQGSESEIESEKPKKGYVSFSLSKKVIVGGAVGGILGGVATAGVTLIMAGCCSGPTPVGAIFGALGLGVLVGCGLATVIIGCCSFVSSLFS